MAEGQALTTAGFSPEHFRNKTIWEALEPAVAQSYEPYFRQALAGKSFKLEHRNHGRFFLSEGVPMPSADGEVEFILVVSYDTTDLKNAETALRSERERLQTILDNLSVGVIFFDKSGQSILSFNKAALDLHGFKSEQDALKLVSDYPSHFSVLDDEDREIPTNEWITANAARGEFLENWQVRLVRKATGVSRSIRYSAFPIHDLQGRLSNVLLQMVDVTEAIKAQEAVRESEERFRTLADNMSQFAWMANQEGWIFWYNKRWYDYTGTTLEEMQGWGWKKVHHPDHVDRVVERIQHCWDTGEVWEDTFPLRGRDGTYRWFLSRALPIRNEQGEIVRWFGTNTDITGLLEAEESLRRRTEELARANSELEAFSYSVSHDLRAPLRTMRGFADFLAEDYSDALDEEGRDYLSRIIAGADKMNTLIDDMLSLSRVSRQEMNIQQVNLSDIAAHVIKELRRNDPDREVEILIEQGLSVSGDARLLDIALTNLLGNAWKYTAKAEHPRIEFGRGEHEGEPAYFIRDNGAGFDMKDADKLFKPFQRLHSDSEFAGTGVGLPIVERVIGRHGGKIWAESEVGRRAVFWFTLGIGESGNRGIWESGNLGIGESD
jgi:PAS domain S-box-containing protein